MEVTVFDSDVLIGFMNADDAHHEAAVGKVRGALAPGARRLLCAVNLSEILIGPIRRGTADRVDALLVRYNIEAVEVDVDLARRAAAVRARTGLKLPDAYVLGTAIHAEHRGRERVRVATFDERVMRAHAELQADSAQPGSEGTP